MATVLIGAGLALALALLVAIYRKLDGIPSRVGALHERGDAQALTALKHATAVEVATITAALRSYEEHVADQYHHMVAAAETRARVAERRSSDAAVALSAASELVRELRALLDGLGLSPAVVAGGCALRPAAPTSSIEPDDARSTVPMGAPAAAADDDEPEEELTAVAPRPIAATSGGSNGQRIAPRTNACVEGRP